MLLNIHDLAKSLGMAAGAALLYISTFGSTVYAQEAPKPAVSASQVQRLENKAKEELDRIKKAKTTEEKLQYLKSAYLYYRQAEDAEPGNQFSAQLKAIAAETKSLEETLNKEKSAAAKKKAEDLIKQAKSLHQEYQKIKNTKEQIDCIQKILALYKQAEDAEPGDQYKKDIEYFQTVLKTVNENAKKEQPKTEPPKTGPSKAEPLKKPDKPATAQSQPAGGTKGAAPADQQAQKTDEEEISSFLDIGGRIGINHTTHNDGEHLRLKIGDFASGKAIYDQKFFQTKEGWDVYGRTYAGTARLSIPGLISITATGDNTEERQQQFITQLISDPSFDVKTDTYVKATDANQFLAAAVELGPVWDLGLEASAFDHLKRIITHINQVTYVKNKTLPNGDYADRYTADERSYVRRRGWQAILKHMIECKNEVPFKGFIGMLFDYEKTRIELKGNPAENILSLHLGLTGKINIADHAGITFIGAQQYLDAQGTERDNWPSTPIFAAGAVSLPSVNLAALVDKESKEKFNANATLFGTVSYLLNKHVGGRLGGVISFGYDKAPIEFLNNYFERIGKNTVGLRRELSDMLIESEMEIDARMIPFDIHPPKKWSFMIIGQGGVGKATNLSNEDIQTSFGSIGALLRTPYISIGGMGFYSDTQNGID
ncbi:MAG: hypothetical protein QW666_04640, partial [Candidatus Woesearchaeota archaeon]